MDVSELGQEVVARLEKAYFLIVMDDVWNQADWERLHIALPKENNKGKILITSRNEDVGTYVSCPRASHKLCSFMQDESWELLRLVALRSMDCSSNLADVGQIIAANYHGMSLSLVLIGGILATTYSASDMNVTKKAWDQVSTQVSKILQEDPTDHVNKFIFLSYDALPYNLHACFLYLGVSPEDYEIRVSKLIRKWIGEGFIHENRDERLEKTAQKYLMDLINRNLVTTDKFKSISSSKPTTSSSLMGGGLNDDATAAESFKSLSKPAATSLFVSGALL
ncbi:putative late blight resistance protein R1B-16 [Salvia divinorum]|uniref:Late blight resistance protein R1B-16 n=1 Tax=Salvia divinorum TaxID=28513 RepID=A0ABD1GUN1_SALDI